MPDSAAGQVPADPFEQCNYENWSYADEQKDCYWEMCHCPLFLSCTVKIKNTTQYIWCKEKLSICVEQAEYLLYVHGFIDPIKLKEKKNRFQSVAVLGSASH